MEPLWTLRNVRTKDAHSVISLIDDWWGRPVSSSLKPLFFAYFQNTSWIIEDVDLITNERKIIAFLIGFISQSDEEHPNEAYIHFIGVHPEHRRNKLAHKLYNLFFETVKKRGVTIVRYVYN